MKQLLIPLISAALFCGGCKKEAEAPQPKPEAPAQATVDSLLNKDGSSPPPAPTPAAPDPVSAPATVTPTDTSSQSFEAAASSTELGDLTRALQIFYNIRHRFPTDLGELSRVSNIAIPAVPSGCSLMIDKENQTVKLVRKTGG
jgi:hypothetical protein